MLVTRSTADEASGGSERIRAVASAAAGVLGARSHAELRDVLTDACRRVLSFDSLLFALLDEPAASLRFLDCLDGEVRVPEMVVPLAGTPSERVVHERRSLVTGRSDDPAACGARLIGTMRRSESTLRTPIVAGGRVLGVVAVLSYTPGLYRQSDVEVLETLASVAAAALLNIELLTERRQAQHELERSEERFRSLIERAADIVAVLTAGGTIDYATPSVEWALGYTPAELTGTNAFALIHPDDAPEVIARFSGAARGAGCSGSVEFRVRGKAGEWRILEARAGRGPEASGGAAVAVNARDVTDERRAQQTQRRLGAFLEATPDFVATFDPHGRALSVNAAFRRLAGMDEKSDLSALTLPELFPPAVTERLLNEGIPAAIRDGVWTGETWLADRQGVEIPVSQLLLAHRSANGAVEFLSTLARDISEKKRAEQELREQKTYYEQILENIDVDIAVFDLDFRYEYVNRSAIRDPEMRRWVIGKDHHEYFERRKRDPRMAEERRAWLRRALEERTRNSFEERLETPDGEPRYMVRSHLPVLDAEGNVRRMLAYGLDITELKRAQLALRESEEQLLQSQKMEAVGRLAGGIAHDFNNLLTAIKGFTELLLIDLDERDPRRPFAAEIQSAANRAAALTRQLLAFSRKQVLQPKVLDLNTVVADMDRMLRRLIGEDVELETAYAPTLGRVRADPGQVEQVLLNLVVNARDAMPQGGRLTIETRNVELAAEQLPRTAEVTPGSFVMLAVHDTGRGMSREVQERIFEPFFTTKEQGKGTGLGLSTVYGIVRQSGGYIEVESDLGCGTTLRIYLPRVEEEAARTAVEWTSTGPVQGTETVLLVEDELAVRVLVRRVLDRMGYRVLEAASGDAALAVMEQRTEPIQLLLTDVVMPGMSGRELADLLLARFPGLRVLFMSGYTDEAIVHHGVLDPGVAFLEKPFTPDVLLRRLREVLEAPVETGP